MRRWLPGLLIVGILTTGCRDHFFQVSVHPFFSTTEAPGDVGGRWVSEGDDATALAFVPAEENAWRVDFFDPNAGDGEHREAVLGVVHFGSVGGTLYWDMTAQNTGSTDDLSREHLLELHSVARVRLDGDAMEIAFLKPEWMSEALTDGRVNLAHFEEAEGDGLVLTAGTSDLEAFLQDHGDDPEAFGETLVLHRVQ